MSIYIVQGWGGWPLAAEGPDPRRSSHPASPSAPPPGLCSPGPRAPPQVFTFRSGARRNDKKMRENNKTLQCEVNGAVRSVGRAGLGCSKRARRDWRRDKRLGAPCSAAAALWGRQRSRSSRRSCEAGRRRCGPRAGLGGAVRPRAPSAGRVPGRGPGSLCWPLTSVRRSSHSLDSRLPF